MFPSFIGPLIMLAALGLIGLGLLLVVIGRMQRQAFLPRVGIRLAGFAVAGYAGAWLVGWAAAPTRVLAVGEEVSFCGLDCHLHVSVLRADRSRDLGVAVRFRSDAKRALEYPGLLRIAVVDQEGRTYLPASGMIAEPIHPGEIVERDFRFSLPPGAAAPRLVVTYDGWLDYLVPGAGNPLVQRRARLDLGLGS